MKQKNTNAIIKAIIVMSLLIALPIFGLSSNYEIVRVLGALIGIEEGILFTVFSIVIFLSVGTTEEIIKRNIWAGVTIILVINIIALISFVISKI